MLPNTGEEPYRAVGVEVNEAEILDVAARAQVSTAQDQYSKMYREVLSILHCLRHTFFSASQKQAFLPMASRESLFSNVITLVGKFSTSQRERLCDCANLTLGISMNECVDKPQVNNKVMKNE